MQQIKFYCFLFLAFCCLKKKLLQWFVFKHVNRTYKFIESDNQNSIVQEYSVQSQAISLNCSKMQSSIHLENKLLKKSYHNKQESIEYQKSYELQLLNQKIIWPTNVNVESNFIQTTFGRIAFILIQPIKHESKFIILHSHANYPDLGLQIEDYLSMCNNLKISLIGYDYPGYGLSEGQLTEENIQQSIVAVYQFLNQQGYENRDIILYGQSLGSSPSLYLASQIKIAGIIIESSFKSILNIILNKNKYYDSDAFKNYKFIKDVYSPILIFHGEQDEMVNIEQALELSQLTKNLFRFVRIPNGSHNSIGNFTQEYYSILKEFIIYLQNQ